jgi:hypothetical protein
MRTLVAVTGLVVLPMLTGCASGLAPEPRARDSWSTLYAARPVSVLGPQVRADSARSAPAVMPLSRHETLRSR